MSSGLRTSRRQKEPDKSLKSGKSGNSTKIQSNNQRSITSTPIYEDESGKGNVSFSSSRAAESNRKKTKKKAPHCDFSDVLSSSSDGSGDDDVENRGARVVGKRENEKIGDVFENGKDDAVPRLTRRPLKEVAPETVRSNSATSKSDAFDELSQALSSLSVSNSVGSGEGDSRSDVGDARSRSTVSRQPPLPARGTRVERSFDEPDDSSFEFPLYGSPTRPGEQEEKTFLL